MSWRKELYRGAFLRFRVKTARFKSRHIVRQEILMEHQEEDIKWIFEERINHNKGYIEFTKSQGYQLENIVSIVFKVQSFPSWPSAPKDSYVYS